MAVDALELPELPPPGPSQLEIRFRRLLHCCELRTQQQQPSDQPGAAAPWQSDPKFHCYVDSLRDLLYDLEGSHADSPGPDVLAAYKQHVAWLGRELRPPELPAFCRQAGANGAAPALSAASAVADVRPVDVTTAPDFTACAGAASSSSSNLRQPAPPPLRQPGAPALLLPPSGGAAAQPQQAQAQAQQAQFALGEAARARVRTQQRLQDEMAEDMLSMTAEMKAGALAMQNAIRYRGKLLDQSEEALVDSAANAQSVAAKAKERHRAARWGFCYTCIMLLAVAAVFAGMMVYIKLTAMVGITGRRRG